MGPIAAIAENPKEFDDCQTLDAPSNEKLEAADKACFFGECVKIQRGRGSRIC